MGFCSSSSTLQHIIVIIITINTIDIVINVMSSSFQSLVCEGVALKILFA